MLSLILTEQTVISQPSFFSTRTLCDPGEGRGGCDEKRKDSSQDLPFTSGNTVHASRIPVKDEL